MRHAPKYVGFLFVSAVLVTILTISLFPSVRAQTEGRESADLKSLQKQVEKFFSDLTDRTATSKLRAAEKAFQVLLASGPLAERERAEDVTKLAERAAILDDRYGPYSSSELVGTHAIGTDVYVLRYLYKASRFPVAWTFTFYRTPDSRFDGGQSEWNVIGVRFDSQVDQFAGIAGKD